MAKQIYRHCERSEAINDAPIRRDVDCFVDSLLAMTWEL